MCPKHPASVNQPHRKPPSRVPCVNRPSLRGRGAGPSEDAALQRRTLTARRPAHPPSLSCSLWPHPSGILLSRPQTPTFPTSIPSLSTSICLFPRQVKKRANVPHWCFQQCRRGFLSLPGWGLAGHQVPSSGAGLGAALQGAVLIPRLQRHLLVSPSCHRAQSAPSRLPRMVPLHTVRRSAPPPHRHHPPLHTPRPASGMTQDWAPPLPTLGLCPQSTCADR